MRRDPFASLLLVLVLAACAADAERSSADQADAPDVPVSTRDPFDVPLAGLTKEDEVLFVEGDELFDLPLREADGLGPLYTRTSCGACHAEGARGPGLVQKMSVVESDGTTPAADQSKLPFGHTIHPLVAGGGRTPIVAPHGDATVKVSTRVGPPVLGRGYIEAIADEEIERVEREQAARTDGIHGRINRVVYASERNPDTSVHAHGPGDVVIGRFGLKARIGYLDDFTADALQGDMGITSLLRPTEVPNPDGLLDDAKPGIDLTIASVNKRAQYLRLIAIPRRGKSARGSALFEQVLCATCHVPAMQTRADYPIRVLAGVTAPVYSDLLLHDMGADLADGTGGTDGQATSREWRTAPLIGLRFLANYLHDSRAHSIDEAIRLHAGSGSQASPSVAAYLALPDADRQALVDFTSAL
jgi:CxxC motif-containing protein (DUF1111 family)